MTDHLWKAGASECRSFSFKKLRRSDVGIRYCRSLLPPHSLSHRHVRPTRFGASLRDTKKKQWHIIISLSLSFSRSVSAYPSNRYLNFPFPNIFVPRFNAKQRKRRREKNESKLRSFLILSSRPRSSTIFFFLSFLLSFG